MTKKVYAIILIIILFVIVLIYKNQTIKNKNYVDIKPQSREESIVEVDIKAEFKIVTNGTTRVFTDSKYHNLSDDIYLNPDNPSLINIKKVGITWDDFFKTLPMSLDKNCLVTGTKQKFCTGNGKFLKFYVNDLEVPDALNMIIKNNDKLTVIFE